MISFSVATCYERLPVVWGIPGLEGWWWWYPALSWAGAVFPKREESRRSYTVSRAGLVAVPSPQDVGRWENKGAASRPASTLVSESAHQHSERYRPKLPNGCITSTESSTTLWLPEDVRTSTLPNGKLSSPTPTPIHSSPFWIGWTLWCISFIFRHHIGSAALPNLVLNQGDLIWVAISFSFSVLV